MSPLPVFVLPGGFVPPVALFYVVPGEDETRSPSASRHDAEDHWFVRLFAFFTGDRRGARAR